MDVFPSLSIIAISCSMNDNRYTWWYVVFLRKKYLSMTPASPSAFLEIFFSFMLFFREPPSLTRCGIYRVNFG
ncbi:hypothetical protein CSUI_003427 [Cystoisospora suis]|uniref:Transmembrane protein n=1 Tax=Cystoisospora suis TaxID=483139 RepID=A0A2C6L2J9_9APIC|nr:hypothetical protein CSUI_003427 [Cystoisospora suis]